MNTKTHWDNVYSKYKTNEVGWFEEKPFPSLELIEKCGLQKSDKILDVGSGVTTLLKYLLNDGYKNITALDISSTAIEKAKNNLGIEKSTLIDWNVDDITAPENLKLENQFDLWHDRTVLHFLLEDNQVKGYLNSLNGLVKRGGYVIIAVFSLEGAKKCSGLNIQNYSYEMISELLGLNYEIIDYMNHLYINPNGNKRPYVYTLFRKLM